jgi:squalene-hopene/tetraprenyl-beta-curcumene cyclase
VTAGQRWVSILALCLALGSQLACSHPQQTVMHPWDPKTAAEYLDRREIAWVGWPGAARDHGTFCVSCHTVVPYALSRPLLRTALGEPDLSVNERNLLDNVVKRVRLWNEVEPFYSGKGYDGGKSAESRGTEAILNALILANYDVPSGSLSAITQKAFSNMWDLQKTKGDEKGAWPWLQFNMEPWEAKDSQYYGAALAAIAVGTAPENYNSTPEIQPKLAALRDYLNREYATQSTINQVVLLWASTKLPGLLDSEQQRSLINEVTNQQQSDGGWRLSLLAWPKGWSVHSLARRQLRADWTRQQAQSDGYATGLIVFALRQSGVPAEDPRLKRGLSWLARNQSNEEGSWPSSSLTERRNPSSNVGHFMRDAATAYAVLALSDSGVTSNRASGGENRSGKDERSTISAISEGHRRNPW